MGGAEASAQPSETAIERELREQTIKLINLEGTSINSIRVATEKALKLSAGFLNGDATWKAKSKAVVKDQIDRGAELPPSPKQSPPAKSTKRASPEDDDVAPRKKRKSQTRIESDEEESELSEPEDISEEESRPKKSAPKPKKSTSSTKTSASKPQKKQSRSVSVNIEQDNHKGPKTEESTPLSSAPEDLEEAKPKPDTKSGADSDSDLSSLIDEEPKPKKRRKGAEAPAARGKKKAPTSKGKDADLPPDEAEIKRLQGWLVKCGVRKVWGKELKPCETSKAKIKHLKQMLDDVGMTGRFSIEKANQIKEARELAADIEAVKEGNERWGMEASDEEDDRPRRRLVRGHKNFDFLSSGGEETD